MAEQLQKSLDELLECPVCLSQIKDPKMLPCQHSYCLDPCLKNIAGRPDNRQPGGAGKYTITCPICRKISSFRHLSCLPDDLKLKNLLEIRKNQPQPRPSAPPWEGPSSGASVRSSARPSVPGPSGRLGKVDQKILKKSSPKNS